MQEAGFSLPGEGLDAGSQRSGKSLSPSLLPTERKRKKETHMLAEAQALVEQFERVHSEIFKWSDGLSDDQLNWKPSAQDTNSIGNLMSHILGAEMFSVVERVGGQSVHRDRSAEFGHRVTRDALLQRRAEVERRVHATLDKLTAADLDRVVTTPNGDAPVGRFLMYLLSHLSGHMGQIIMTRKLLDAHQ
jgi:uncharacterized damage-inducible protein DinB